MNKILKIIKISQTANRILSISLKMPNPFKTKSLSLFHFNICSLQKNIHSFNVLHDELNTNGAMKLYLHIIYVYMVINIYIQYIRVYKSLYFLPILLENQFFVFLHLLCLLSVLNLMYIIFINFINHYNHYLYSRCQGENVF